MFTKKNNFDKESLIAVYSRKSRDEGEDSLENHRIRLSDFIKQNGFNNVEWYEEVVSGGTINSRPKFVELLQKVRLSTYSAVLVIDLDRLSRGDTYERGVIERAFKESQTLILTVKGEILDYSDKNEALTANVKGLLANYELEQIKTRLKEGKKLAVQKGVPHSGKVPFGYNWDRNLRQAVVNEDEKRVYRLMVKWYIEDKMSARSIALKLNDLGYKTSTGGIWHGNRVHTTLTNDFHLGYVTHGKWKSIPTEEIGSNGKVRWKTMLNPNTSEIITVKGNHTPIKTEEEHAKIINITLESRTLYANTSLDQGGHSFKLKGLVRCPHCGLVMSVIPNGVNNIPFIRKCHRLSKKRVPECLETVGVNESVLYEILLSRLTEYRDKLFDPLQVEGENSFSAIENEIKMYEESLIKVKKKISKYKEMFEADIIDINELKEKVSKSEKDIERLEFEILKLSKSAEYVKKTEQESKKKLWTSSNVVSLLSGDNNYSDKEINGILKDVISYIVYNRNEDEITMSIVYK